MLHEYFSGTQERVDRHNAFEHLKGDDESMIYGMRTLAEMIPGLNVSLGFDFVMRTYIYRNPPHPLPCIQGSIPRQHPDLSEMQMFAFWNTPEYLYDPILRRENAHLVHSAHVMRFGSEDLHTNDPAYWWAVDAAYYFAYDTSNLVGVKFAFSRHVRAGLIRIVENWDKTLNAEASGVLFDGARLVKTLDVVRLKQFMRMMQDENTAYHDLYRFLAIDASA